MTDFFFPWCFNWRSRLTSNSVVTHSLFLTKSKNCVQPHSHLFYQFCFIASDRLHFCLREKKNPGIKPSFCRWQSLLGRWRTLRCLWWPPSSYRKCTKSSPWLRYRCHSPLSPVFFADGRCPHRHSNPHGVPDSVLYCVSDAGAAGLQYSHTGQSRGDLHHLCQPHLCHRGAWEGEVVKMMRFFFIYFLSDVWIFLFILLIKFKNKTNQSYS